MWPDSRRFEFFDFEQCITESDCQGMAPKCQKLSCHVAIWWCQRTGTKHHRQAHWSRKDAGDRHCAIIASQVTLVVENLPANARDMGSIPRLGRAPGKRKWQPTPVFLPGESHGQRILVGYIQSTSSQRIRHHWAHVRACAHTHSHVIVGWCVLVASSWFSEDRVDES